VKNYEDMTLDELDEFEDEEDERVLEEYRWSLSNMCGIICILEWQIVIFDKEVQNTIVLCTYQY
jgi:hypothetical protein